MLQFRYITLLLIIIIIPIITAPGLQNDNLPIVRPEPTSLPSNTTINISVNSSTYWDTLDHGPLGYVSDLMHNWLGGLQGGAAGEYYHMNSSVYTYFLANVFNWATLSQVNNIHNQDLNTTNNVTFNTMVLTCGGANNATNNDSCLNITGDIYVRDIHARDGFYANTTIHIGDSITLSASGTNGSNLNISGGNVSADVYYGSGKYLTDLNLTNISFAGDTINASQFNGNFTGSFFGTYDWRAHTPWLSFNGTDLYLNESYLRNQTEVTLQVYLTNITTSGGSGSAITPLLDFQITEIIVTPSSLSSKYRFEMTEGGNYIDKDRTLHTGVWDIEKSYAINGTATINITSSNPSVETYSITIKYLSNWL